jgi:protein-disulfide isomerase
MGHPSAQRTIIEYTSFNSQFGAMGNQTVREVLEHYPNDVRFIFKQKPEPKDEVGAQAAEAALCAHDQKKYWDYRQKLFEASGQLSRESLTGIARNLSLDVALFGRCLEQRKHQAKVETDGQEARRYGMGGTPAFAVNGTPLSGAHSFRMFRRLIEVELAPKKKTADIPGSGAPHG